VTIGQVIRQITSKKALDYVCCFRALISSHRFYTHFKTGKFFTYGIYLLFYCQKSGNEPGACTKRYSRIRIFTFYFSKAEQYTSGRVQNVGCVYYCCCSYYAAAHYTWKSVLTVVDFDWSNLLVKLSIPCPSNARILVIFVIQDVV